MTVKKSRKYSRRALPLSGKARKRKLVSRKSRKDEDEEIPSSDELIEDEPVIKRAASDESDDEDFETEEQKRCRLAKQYLSKLEEEEEDVAKIVKNDYLELKGISRQKLANAALFQHYRTLNGHRHVPTASLLADDCERVFSASKDAVIIESSLESGKRITVRKRSERSKPTIDTVAKIKGHSSPIYCLCYCKEAGYLLSGDRDGLLIVWNAQTLKHVHTFLAHRLALTGISCTLSGAEAFTCSKDKTIKLWNMIELAFVETIYGHEMAINDINANICKHLTI